MSTPLTDAINALTTYANEITGKADTNLPDAVRSLADGYATFFQLSQAEYDALPVKDPDTLYVIVEGEA